MRDLRDQIESLSAAEKLELQDAVWESLEVGAASLTDVQREELDRTNAHQKDLPMRSRRNKSGRSCQGTRNVVSRFELQGRYQL
jgi:Putative addiction module component